MISSDLYTNAVKWTPTLLDRSRVSPPTAEGGGLPLTSRLGKKWVVPAGWTPLMFRASIGYVAPEEGNCLTRWHLEKDFLQENFWATTCRITQSGILRWSVSPGSCVPLRSPASPPQLRSTCEGNPVESAQRAESRTPGWSPRGLEHQTMSISSTWVTSIRHHIFSETLGLLTHSQIEEVKVCLREKRLLWTFGSGEGSDRCCGGAGGGSVRPHPSLLQGSGGLGPVGSQMFLCVLCVFLHVLWGI